MAIKLTTAQASMVATYACESVHECSSMRLDGQLLHVLDVDAARSDLLDASNSADEDKTGSGAIFLRIVRKLTA